MRDETTNTTAAGIDDRNYWVLEHSSRAVNAETLDESEAMWVRHAAYTCGSESNAGQVRSRIEREWIVPGYVVKHRFELRNVRS